MDINVMCSSTCCPIQCWVNCSSFVVNFQNHWLLHFQSSDSNTPQQTTRALSMSFGGWHTPSFTDAESNTLLHLTLVGDWCAPSWSAESGLAFLSGSQWRLIPWLANLLLCCWLQCLLEVVGSTTSSNLNPKPCWLL